MGVERHREEALLPAALHERPDVEEGAGDLAAANDRDHTRLLDDVQTRRITGSRRHEHRRVESGRHLAERESGHRLFRGGTGDPRSAETGAEHGQGRPHALRPRSFHSLQASKDRYSDLALTEGVFDGPLEGLVDSVLAARLALDADL